MTTCHFRPPQERQRCRRDTDVRRREKGAGVLSILLLLLPLLVAQAALGAPTRRHSGEA